MSRSSLFYSVIAEGKNEFFKRIMSYFYWGDVIAKPGIVNPVKIRYLFE